MLLFHLCVSLQCIYNNNLQLLYVELLYIVITTPPVCPTRTIIPGFIYIYITICNMESELYNSSFISSKIDVVIV